MKQKLFTLLLLTTIALASCNKNKVYPDIKQYDQSQIESYIAANGLTGMVRDTIGHDTSGIYYQTLTTGDTSQPLDYSTNVSFVYTLKSFDGKFVAMDTVVNHFDGAVGHATPNGLILAIHDLLKYRGGRMRVLIPSHLAYGVNGIGSGSSTNTSGRIAGNQCLDYYVHAVDNQSTYDDLVIRNYMTAKSLSGFTKTASGLYYKITTPGTSATAITYNSTVVCTYTGQLFNGTIFDQYNTTGGTTFNIPDLTDGVAEGLQYATPGASITLLIPSALEYGPAGASGIPSNACLRFDFAVISATP